MKKSSKDMLMGDIYDAYLCDTEQADQEEQSQTEGSMVVPVIRSKRRGIDRHEDVKDIIAMMGDTYQYSWGDYNDEEDTMITEEDLQTVGEFGDAIECISESYNVDNYETLTWEDMEDSDALIKTVASCMDLTYEQVEGDLLCPRDGPNKVKMRQKILGVSSQPYAIGKYILQKYNFCFLDAFATGTTLCFFNGKYWQKLSEEELKQLVYNTLEENVKLETKGVESMVSNVAAYISREVRKAYDEGKKRFTDEDYHSIQNHLVFQNCIYDVEHGVKLDFTDKKPYSFMVNCEYLEENISTPNYDKIKSDATGFDVASMKMYDHMQVYLLLPNRSGKCFFVMSYARDSGKNILGEFIEKYFDRNYVQTMDTEFFGGKFSFAGFDTARLATCLEMPVKQLTSSAAKAIKACTGNSTIEIEAKYVNRISAQVQFKILLATNGGIFLPAGEMDEAFYRRVIVIPFVHSTPLDKLIADLPMRLEQERSAIISKCVRGFKEVFAADGGIVFPESALSKQIKAGWTGQSLFNEEFVESMLEFTAKDEDVIPKVDLEYVYDMYYEQNAGNVIGCGKPLHCSKDILVKLIQSVYPGVEASKRRRNTICEPNTVVLRPSLTRVAWTEKARSYVGGLY